MTWSGSPTLDRSSQRIRSARKSSSNHDDDAGSEEGFGDEFDEFEEGAQLGENDDFSDFNDGFKGPPAVEEVSEPPPTFVSRPCSVSSKFIPAHRRLSIALMLIL